MLRTRHVYIYIYIYIIYTTQRWDQEYLFVLFFVEFNSFQKNWNQIDSESQWFDFLTNESIWFEIRIRNRIERFDLKSNHFETYVKLIKHFRFLPVWLKTSDIWRWLSDLKWRAFWKVQILMFFDEQVLNIN